MKSPSSDSRSPQRTANGTRWLDTLAAGFLAGTLGGLAFLAIGLARDGADFLAYWPTVTFALWLIVRSVAIYTLVFGIAGLILAGALHLILRRGRHGIFALVLGAMTAMCVLANLTAWWQLEVLGGLPMADPARLRGALAHGFLALGAGTVVAALSFLLRRRGTTSTKPAAIAFFGAIFALILGEVGLEHSGPRAGSPMPGKPSQVVVVGLDGMTLRVLSPLLRSGELPAIERLMMEGAWGTLLTYGTASSPQVWTSMATGKRVRDHGIDDFVKTHGGPEESPSGPGQKSNYRAALMRSSDRQTQAIWNILSDSGRRVAVVDWLVTFPPEEVSGYIVSRLKHNARDRTHPPGLDVELANLWAPRPEGHRQQLLWNIDRVFSTAEHLLAKERLDFLAIYDATVDRVEHENWKHYETAKFDPELWQIDGKDVTELSSLIPDVYRHLDRRLGELLERVSDDTLVIVVSDHGQRAADLPRIRLRLDRVLAALGYTQLLPGTGSRDPVDYSKSRAYTLVETPWTPVLRVNLNLQGRETRGTVAIDDAAAIRRQLAEDLRAVRFEDGTPLFTAVTPRPTPRKGPEAALPRRGNQGADLRVALSRHARSFDRSSDRLMIGDRPLPLSHYQHVNSKISGAHDHQGIIFARGPGIEPGFIGQRVVPTAIHDLLWHLTDKIDAIDRLLPTLRWLGWIERASTLDLTPTVLHALGLPVAQDMFGRPLTDLFSDPPTVEWVASYEATRDATPKDEGLPTEEPSDEDVLKRLRALGYVD